MLPVLARPNFPSCSFSVTLSVYFLFPLSWVWVSHVRDQYKSLRRTLQLFINFTSWCCSEATLNQVNMEWTWKGAASCTLNLFVQGDLSFGTGTLLVWGAGADIFLPCLDKGHLWCLNYIQALKTCFVSYWLSRVHEQWLINAQPYVTFKMHSWSFTYRLYNLNTQLFLMPPLRLFRPEVGNYFFQHEKLQLCWRAERWDAKLNTDFLPL